MSLSNGLRCRLDRLSRDKAHHSDRLKSLLCIIKCVKIFKALIQKIETFIEIYNISGIVCALRHLIMWVASLSANPIASLGAFYYQSKAIKRFPQNTKRLIIYLIPQSKGINGGIMSIFSLCHETRKLKDIHNATVMLVTFPSIFSYYKNDLFINSEIIISFSQISRYFTNLNFLLLNIPEYSSDKFTSSLTPKEQEFLRNIPEVRFNLMNQNIAECPDVNGVNTLREYSDNITITCAQKRYCTQKLSDQYKMPVHRFGTRSDLREYYYKPYSEKENIIVLSNDFCYGLVGNDRILIKQRVMEVLSDKLPVFKQIIVKDMKYEEYKQLISQAKYAITFGEGFDGYFAEPIASGSLSFAVYNDDFFPEKKYLEYPNVFSSYEQMLDTIISKINLFEENPAYYAEISDKLRNEIFSDYGDEIYRERIKKYYLGDYDYKPQA